MAVASAAAYAQVSPRPGEPSKVDEPATTSGPSGVQANNSPTLAVDPTNSRFVALANRIDAKNFGCALQLSGEGGSGWVGADPVPRLPAGAEKCYAPEVAFDRSGRLYFLFVGLSGRGNTPMGAFLVVSRDRGRSFSAPRKVLGPNNFQIRMAIDASGGPNDGRIHMVWLAARRNPGTGSLPPPPNPIMASYSDDRGKSWSSPARVSDTHRELAVAPALALTDRGHPIVVYYDLKGDLVDYHGLEGPVWSGKWSLISSRSRDFGREYLGGKIVSADIHPPSRVMLIFTMPPAALYSAGNTTFSAWPDSRFGDADVLFSRSVSGRPWTAPVRLDDDPVAGGAIQDLPKLSVWHRRVDAIFYDRRRDPENIRNDVYYTSSLNGGRSFAPAVIINSKPSDSRIGRKYSIPSAVGQTEFGSRLALVSNRDSAVAAWTDTSNSVYPLQQDVFTTRISVPTQSNQIG